MKILQLGKFYPIRGGVEKVMYDLMMGLSKRQIHCDMLCASTEDHPAGVRQLNAYARLIVVPTQVKAAATMLAPAMIGKLRKIGNQYDMIHIHHPDPMACLALFLSGYKGKVVLHWHSDILKQKVLLKAYAPLQKWLINRADKIIGTTPVYVRESPFLAKVQDKTDFLPIGIEPVVAEGGLVELIRRRYPGKKLIFSLGRLVEYKGYAYLIQAAAELDDSYHIVIGGKGPLKEELEALIARLGVENRVTLYGFMSDEEVAAYFKACHVFCLSSIWKTEAFAIVQIEAMSCGKPVVSTHIPGSGVSWVNADGESGKVVQIEDGHALAQGIQKVCRANNYERLAQGSRARYEALFTEEKMIDRCVELYNEVLSEDKRESFA